MLLFFALGNNEEKYFQTKHNIGRRVLEEVAVREDLKFQKSDKFYFAKTRWGQEEVILLYSSGYMNLSGEAFIAFLKYYKINLSSNEDFLIVLQDDSDQIEGNMKFVLGGGSAGHRGIDSIYKHLLNSKLDLSRLWRLKIGIRPAQNTQKSETFVLNRLSKEDDQSIQKVANIIETHKMDFEMKDWDRLQQKVNTK